MLARTVGNGFEFNSPTKFGLGQKMNRLHLDYETRCDLDLKEVGAHRYLNHPSFEVLLTAWAWGDGEVEQADGFWSPPVPSIVHAFNAPFEMGVIRRIEGLSAVERHEWRCTMAHAYARGFAKGLKDVGKQIGLPVDKAKIDRGSRLITKFCKPRKPSKSNPDRYWIPRTASEAWAEFKLYNLQDVVAEREVWRFLKAQGPWTRAEQDLWMLDRKINQRGVPVDLARVAAAIDMAERFSQEAGQEMRELTGIWPSEVAQLLEWAQGQGYPFTTLAKGPVEEWLQDHPEGLLARVLRLRLDFAQSATKKFNAIRDRNYQGRMYDTMQFCGASRTGRWAGRGLQLQNLKRPTIKDPSAASDFLVEDPEGFKMFYDLEVLGSLIRSAIKASPGKRLVVSDLSSIEMVVLAWMTRDPALGRIFREGKDPYKVFAEMWLGVPYDEVEKATRNLCKPPMLGCFGAETLVLTDTGWKPIISISKLDRLWDGERWVSHSGVIPQGEKQTEERWGVRATPDHLILVDRGQWVSWSDLGDADLIQATKLASGPWLSLTEGTGYAGAPAVGGPGLLPATFTEGSRLLVSLAQTGESGSPVISWRQDSASLVSKSSDSPIASTRKGLVARTPATRLTGEGESSAGSPIRRTLFGISSLSRGGITRLWNWIVSTTMGIMRKETCVSLLEAEICRTPGLTDWSSTREGCTPRRSFTGSTPSSTETGGPCAGRLPQGSPPSASSKSRPGAVVPTFDILNAGPLHRYTILTDRGPVIAHNCGYGLGASGLVRYAESLGVEMDEDTALGAVQAYRTRLPAVPVFWRNIESAFRWAVRSPGTVFGRNIGFPMRYNGRTLVLRLPSGRCLYYDQPEVDEAGDLSYMGQNQFTGQWDRIRTWGGKLTENADQAIARDLLAHALRLYDQTGGYVVGHVHDEMIAEESEDQAERWLEVMNQCFTTPPDWFQGIPLKAEGYASVDYRKN